MVENKVAFTSDFFFQKVGQWLGDFHVCCGASGGPGNVFVARFVYFLLEALAQIFALLVSRKKSRTTDRAFVDNTSAQHALTGYSSDDALNVLKSIYWAAAAVSESLLNGLEK